MGAPAAANADSSTCAHASGGIKAGTPSRTTTSTLIARLSSQAGHGALDDRGLLIAGWSTAGWSMM